MGKDPHVFVFFSKTILKDYIHNARVVAPHLVVLFPPTKSAVFTCDDTALNMKEERSLFLFVKKRSRSSAIKQNRSINAAKRSRRKTKWNDHKNANMHGERKEREKKKKK